MVDVLKYPSASFTTNSTSIYANLFHSRCKTPSEQMSASIFMTNTTSFPVQNYLNSLGGKCWIGRRPGDPPRLLDVANAPYGIHRRIIHQELSRPVPTRQEFLQTVRSKQSKTSTTSYLTVQAESKRLFDALSKHITVKSEPLRTTNHLNHTSTSTLTSWQKYWASTHAERRRKEASESEPLFYLPKTQQQQQVSPMPSETQFVVLRDSPITQSRTTSGQSEKLLSNSSEENPMLSKETFSTTFEIHSLMADSIEIPFKSSDEDEEEKNLLEKSFVVSSSSSSPFKTESQIIDEVADAQKSNEQILPKTYEFAAPIITKKSNKVQRRQRLRSKSKEKKEQPTYPKRFQPISTSSKISIQSNSSTKKTKSIASKTTATPITKPREKKWDDPYVGIRRDPPTPPSSPSCLMFSSQDDSNEMKENSLL